MRINIYDEEVTGEVVAVRKTASDTGKVFIGLRLMLESPDVLHSGPDDDDRSAVTFWYEDGQLDQMTKVRDTLSALADADFR